MMDFFKICALPFRILSSIFEPSTNNARADSLIDSTPGLHSSSLNLPPVRFHSTHGSNVILQKNRTVARRQENFCKGLTFSDRPIVIDEKIYIKLIDKSDNWGGVIRFGYTSHDPITLENRLPKYACPDLTNQSGFWAKAVEERLVDKDATLYFYVNRYGTVFYGIEGRPKNEFFNGVDVSGPLWAIIDVYGNSTAVELIDVRLNNSSAAHQDVGFAFNDAGCSDTDIADTELANSFSTLSCHSYSDGTHEGFDQRLAVVPIHSNIGVEFSGDASEASNPGYMLCPLSAQTDLDSKYFDLRLTPVPFHAKYGLNVRLSSSRLIASRLETEYSLGYVFTPRPIRENEFIVIEVLKTDSTYLSGLAFGVTSENPGLIDVVDLPEDADELINRTNTFIVSKNVANTPCEGDILIFSMTETGEVRMKKNCENEVLLFYVEKNVPYWWFFDVYGSTIEIRAFSGILASSEPVSSTSPVRQEMMTSSSTSSSEVVVAPAAPIAASSEYSENSGDSVPTSSNGAGGYSRSHTVMGNSQPVLIVKCYSDGVEPINIVLRSQTTCHRDAAQGSQPVGSHVPSSATTNASVYSVQGNRSDDSTCENGRNREYRLREWAKSNWRQQPGGHRPNECSVCFERPVDAVLYTCGHMCLCYDCAHELWRGSRGDGHCPICRAIIKDVIRTYKS